MRIFTLTLLAALFCSCEESKYYIHITNNAGQTVLYALAKDSGTTHSIREGEKAVHQVSFGVPHGLASYGPEEGKTKNIGVRYIGDDSYEFYPLAGIPFSVINTLSFDVELRCGGYLSAEPLEVPGQSQVVPVVPGEASVKIYTQTPIFGATFEDAAGQEYPAQVTFTVKYDDDDQAEEISAVIR
ncbi:MAG: hypothetical protein LBR93_07555 [Treponema sp.]|jgi:hypothetical protein|nr:hypothetical protein [Treponema sp.]